MNANGASITVDIALSDTPFQIIGKAIKQCGSEAAIIMNDPTQFNDLTSRGTDTIQTAESQFAIEGKTDYRALEFNLPIQDQVAKEIEEAKSTGRTLGFVVAIALIVG